MSGTRLWSSVVALAALACSLGCKGKSPEPVERPNLGASAAHDVASSTPPPPRPADVVAVPTPAEDGVEPPPADAAPPPVDDVPSPPPPPPPATDAADEGSAPPEEACADGLYGMMTGATENLGVAEASLCRLIENRLCVEPTRVFAPGDMVWILLKVSNTSAAEQRVLVSYVAAGEDAPVGRGVTLRVPAQPTYTTFAKGSKADPGCYDVVVRDEQETTLARVTFEVR
jgi:hypothetical protein